MCFGCSLGSVVGFLRAHDADEEGSLNSLLNYSLLSQSPTNPSSKMFHIDQVKGKIQVANEKFKRNEVPLYKLLFSVSDEGTIHHLHFQLIKLIQACIFINVNRLLCFLFQE